MQNVKRTTDFDEIWSKFYQIIKLIAKDIHGKSIDVYCYSLYDRAIYIFDAHVAIEKTNNISAIAILLRSLYEIKIKASKYQDDKASEMKTANNDINKEIERFKKKVDSGESVTFQLIRKYFQEYLSEIKISIDSEEKRTTIKSNSEKADLAFDYETLYWITSLFTHSHPLSLVLEHKNQFDQNIIFKILDPFIRDMDLMNIHVLGTMLWITKYLYEDYFSQETKEKTDNLWAESREIISNKYNFEWKIDPSVEIGTFKYTNDEGAFEIKRKQRK